MSEPVEVNIGACQCPGTPHPDGDLVYLRAKPDLALGLAAQSALDQAGRYAGDNEAAVYSAYVRYGVVAWNIRDATGAIRPSHEAILDRLEWLSGGKAVALKAQELYRDKVFAPLARAKAEPPRPSRRGGSTSPSRRSGAGSQSSPQPPSRLQAEAGA